MVLGSVVEVSKVTGTKEVKELCDHSLHRLSIPMLGSTRVAGNVEWRGKLIRCQNSQ